MRVFAGETDVTARAVAVELERSRADAAATLRVTLWQGARERDLPRLSLALGDAVHLVGEAGQAVFTGAVQTLTRTSERVTLLACDEGLYLTKNELSGVFAGSAEEVCRAVAARLALPVGTLDCPDETRCIVARARRSAFSLLREAAGEAREIAVRGGALHITRTGETSVEIPAGRVLACESTADLRGMVTRCTVLTASGHAAAAAEDAASASRYGERGQIVWKRGDAREQAARGLRGRRVSGELLVCGDLRLACGVRAVLACPEWGLDGAYPVVAVRHTWRAGRFTSELTWEAER